jgi:hypothetical protein
MTLREQALLAVLTFLLIPLALKASDALMVAARKRFGTPRRKSYAELERENWQLRDTLRRVHEGVSQLETWQGEGKADFVAVGIVGLRSEIDLKLIEN